MMVDFIFQFLLPQDKTFHYTPYRRLSGFQNCYRREVEQNNPLLLAEIEYRLSGHNSYNVVTVIFQP
jgi:hypothetical protein